MFKFDFDVDLVNQVAVARVMLMKPKMVFLDEATSALDGNNEILVYRILKEVCPTLVSVGHRPALLDLHDMVGNEAKFREFNNNFLNVKVVLISFQHRKIIPHNHKILRH